MHLLVTNEPLSVYSAPNLRRMNNLQRLTVFCVRLVPFSALNGDPKIFPDSDERVFPRPKESQFGEKFNKLTKVDNVETPERIWWFDKTNSVFDWQ